MAVKLKAINRDDLSKSATKKLRKQGQVPGVVYGKDKEAKTIAVDNLELVKTLRDEGKNAIITLDVENDEAVKVMLHEYQTDSIKENMIHVDFLVVDMSEELEVSVPVRIEGEAAGVKEGGVLEQPEFELMVKAKPADIPEDIAVDVSAMNIGDVITIGDLPKADKYELLGEPETVVVTIVPPTTSTDTQISEEVTEPELVGEDKDNE